MDIQTIINTEQNNKKAIFLHREGVFWKAYEQSAFLFVKHIKPYSVKKRYYKKIGGEVVSIGFPDSILESLLQLVADKEVQKTEKQITIEGFEPEGAEAFEEWKNGVEALVPAAKQEAGHGLLEKIRGFPIVNKSPMECQQFLLNLQNRLNG